MDARRSGDYNSEFSKLLGFPFLSEPAIYVVNSKNRLAMPAFNLQRMLTVSFTAEELEMLKNEPRFQDAITVTANMCDFERLCELGDLLLHERGFLNAPAHLFPPGAPSVVPRPLAE